jgi:hypothetical protein
MRPVALQVHCRVGDGEIARPTGGAGQALMNRHSQRGSESQSRESASADSTFGGSGNSSIAPPGPATSRRRGDDPQFRQHNSMRPLCPNASVLLPALVALRSAPGRIAPVDSNVWIIIMASLGWEGACPR